MPHKNQEAIDKFRSVSKEEINLLCESGVSLYDIATKYGVSRNVVYGQLDRFNLQTKPRTVYFGKDCSSAVEGAERLRSTSKEDLERMYYQEEMPVYLMAEFFGCDEELIRSYLVKIGIELRTKKDSCKLSWKNSVSQGVKNSFSEQTKKNLEMFAQSPEKRGCWPGGKPTNPDSFEEFKLVQKEKLEAIYNRPGVTICDIAESYGISYSFAYDWMVNRLGIKVKGKTTYFYMGIKTRLNLGGVDYTFKSSWEVEFATYLYNNKIKFKYETLRIGIIGSNSKYIPDFLLTDFNLICEVKPLERIDETTELKRKSTELVGYNFMYVTENELNNLDDWKSQTLLNYKATGNGGLERSKNSVDNSEKSKGTISSQASLRSEEGSETSYSNPHANAKEELATSTWQLMEIS